MLLEPFAATERDAAFQALYGEALLRTGRLDPAREVFQAYYAQKPEGFVKLFELAAAYIRAGQDAKAAALLVQTKETMRGLRKEVELSAEPGPAGDDLSAVAAASGGGGQAVRGTESGDEIFRFAGEAI